MRAELSSFVALFGVGLVAGAVNSIAGGGSLLTFPTLLALGVGPLAANATNTVALVPGSAAAFWKYRDTLANTRTMVLAMALPSVVGGVLGAWLVLRAGDATFARLAPWLILAATALFAAQEPIARRMVVGEGTAQRLPLRALVLFQFVVATYGGFFGAGIGILMLAALGVAGVRDVHRANGLKNLAAVCINGIAAVTFVLAGDVEWFPAGVIAVGAIVGGAAGAAAARRVEQKHVRRAILAIGVGIAAWMFTRTFG